MGKKQFSNLVTLISHFFVPTVQWEKEEERLAMFGVVHDNIGCFLEVQLELIGGGGGRGGGERQECLHVVALLQ